MLSNVTGAFFVSIFVNVKGSSYINVIWYCDVVSYFSWQYANLSFSQLLSDHTQMIVDDHGPHLLNLANHPRISR